MSTVFTHCHDLIHLLGGGFIRGARTTGRIGPFDVCWQGARAEQQDGDVLQEGIRVLARALMEAKVPSLIGAEPYERTGKRSTYCNRVAPGRGTLA